MKKIFALVLAALMLLALAACGRQDTTSPTGQADPNAATQATLDPSGTAPAFDMQTSEDKRIVNIGTVDKTLYAAPILVTSFGQSTDASTIDTALKRVGGTYSYLPQVAADAVGSYKTMIICVGASTKGLGQAGIDEKDEVARAEAIMAKAKETGAQVIFVHIGGETRRGALSDQLADLVLPQCSYMIVKEDANWDYKFTKYAEEHSLPLTLIFGQKDTVQVMSDLFSK
ncbi:MAG: hypothetical protein J5496_09025 [Lachnospiraceae bacterium]|nr:hypothetical protein [Lachnospiraceae bacterium]